MPVSVQLSCVVRSYENAILFTCPKTRTKPSFIMTALTKTVAQPGAPSLAENTGARAPPRMMTLGLRDPGSKTLSQKISDQRLTPQTDIDGTDFLANRCGQYNYNNECDQQRRSQPRAGNPRSSRFSDRMAHRGTTLAKSRQGRTSIVWARGDGRARPAHLPAARDNTVSPDLCWPA